MFKFYDLVFLYLFIILLFFCNGTFLLLIRHSLFSFRRVFSSFTELVSLEMPSSLISQPVCCQLTVLCFAFVVVGFFLGEKGHVLLSFVVYVCA